MKKLLTFRFWLLASNQGGSLSYPADSTGVEWVYPTTFSKVGFAFYEIPSRTSSVAAAIRIAETTAYLNRCITTIYHLSKTGSVQLPSADTTAKVVAIGY